MSVFFHTSSLNELLLHFAWGVAEAIYILITAIVCLSVCLCVVSLSLAAFPHYCMDLNVTWGNDRGCPVVVQFWADLQSLHGFRCYDNIASNAKCQRVLVFAVCLVMVALWNRADHYIFILLFLSSIFLYLFSSPNLSGRRLDVYHTSTHGVALCEF